MKAYIEIEDCSKCPHAKFSKVYTPDSWDDVKQIHCNKLNKVVNSYWEWRDKPFIPKDCPLIEKTT